jgi:hypothetical protein
MQESVVGHWASGIGKKEVRLNSYQLSVISFQPIPDPRFPIPASRFLPRLKPETFRLSRRIAILFVLVLLVHRE